MAGPVGRSFQVAGPALLRVKFGPQILNGDGKIVFGDGDQVNGAAGSVDDDGLLYELGLTLEDIRITIRQYHLPVHIDSYGMEVPAELLTMGAEAYIHANLIHFDRQVLEICLAESQGGAIPGIANAGTMPGAGILMGGGVMPGQSGNHYIELQVIPQLEGIGDTPGNRVSRPWRFPTALLMDRTEMPIGATKISTLTTWVARPFPVTSADINQELVSRNTILYDHTIPDLDEEEEE
jgi:hypothetical protein